MPSCTKLYCSKALYVINNNNVSVSVSLSVTTSLPRYYVVIIVLTGLINVLGLSVFISINNLHYNSNPFYATYSLVWFSLGTNKKEVLITSKLEGINFIRYFRLP